MQGQFLTKTGECLEYKHLIKHPKYKETWSHSCGNEIGRIAQEMPGRVSRTDTISFISKTEIPQEQHKDVTYGCIMCDYRKEKAELNRIKLMVDGDRITYPDDYGTTMAGFLTVQLLLNSVISIPHKKL